MRAGPATARRFIEHVADYVTSVTEEAGLREKNIVLDLESYDTIRRDNSAVRTAFGLFGYVLGHDLPDEIFYHPVYMDMYLAAVDMVTWANVSWCSLDSVVLSMADANSGPILLRHGAGYGPYHE